MARPIKQGLDYFPLDTNFFNNPKIKKLRRSHGCEGVATYMNILCKIYGAGYYFKFNDIEELSMDIAEEITNAHINHTASKVACVINYLIEQGMLDKALFERGILTSTAAQEQYFLSIEKSKRKALLEKENLIVDIGDIIAKNDISSEETRVCSEETRVYSEVSTQNKINKNKENKTLFKSACASDGEKERKILESSRKRAAALLTEEE